MKSPYYQIDAFTGELFSGNPAGVCLLDEWLEDGNMQSIAAENNLSETAFIVPGKSGLELRWFSPATEVKLCGHATLASAKVVFDYLNPDGVRVDFHTRYSGVLSVTKNADILNMDFPSRPPSARISGGEITRILGVEPQEVWKSEEDLLVLLENQEQISKLKPDMTLLAKIDCRGVIVTAKGHDCDFVSRFFAPRVGIPEDPVTGSAHCVLVPFWSERLKKKTLFARQVSRRGGELFCEDNGNRVIIGGRARVYLKGEINY